MRLPIALSVLLFAGATAARALGYVGTGTTVAILDTGVDSRDPAVVAEHCFVAPDGWPNGTGEQNGAGSAQGDQGHGTAMKNVVDARRRDSNPIAGTSVAAAQVSGAAAVLLAAVPALTHDTLLSLLESTGTPILDARNGITTPRIDLAAAVAAATGKPVPLLPPPPGLASPVAPVLSQPTVPKASLSTSKIAFGSPVRTRRLVIRNDGTGFLAVRVTTSLRSLSIRPAKLTIAAAHKGKVVITFHPPRRGVYRGSLRFSTDDPTARTITIPVRASAATTTRRARTGPPTASTMRRYDALHKPS